MEIHVKIVFDKDNMYNQAEISVKFCKVPGNFQERSYPCVNLPF